MRSFNRGSGERDNATVAFFSVLFEAFCNNAVAAVALCLLCELFEEATSLIVKIGCAEMTVELLCELDKLVQLVESPVFASMRLQLLEPGKNQKLFGSLFALLMILPQSAAFVTLHRRLSAATAAPLSLAVVVGSGMDTQKSALGFDMTALFEEIQRRHARFREIIRIEDDRKSLAEETRSGRKLLDGIRKKVTLM